MAEEVNQVEENAQEALQQQIETANEENVAAESQQEEVASNVTVDEDGTIKLDLRQQPQTQEEDAVQEQETASRMWKFQPQIAKRWTEKYGPITMRVQSSSSCKMKK